MKIEQLYTGCLAEAAYFIESAGEAAVIDPIRETEPYLRLAQERGVKIKYIFETHFHADFVSGHLDLSRATGAPIVFGPTAKAQFDFIEAKDGQTFEVGDVIIKVLHTPGHTPESMCLLLYDENGKEHAVFTGDTLFVGDVGRPDLLDGVIISKEEQVSNLYDSLNKKIKTLPDDVIVYPGHGPGSLCGKSIGKETQSTIGREKMFNYALQPMTREEFMRIILADQPPAPQYFVKNAIINRTGYEAIDHLLERNVRPLSVTAVELEMEAGALVLDTRNTDAFAAGHIPNAMQVALDGSFAVWVGTLVSDIKQRIVVIADQGRERESILRLARVGYENVAGYLEGGFDTWRQSGMPIATTQVISAEQFEAIFDPNTTKVLDVRRTNEFKNAHLPNAINIPLRDLEKNLHQLNPNECYYVHCAGGYRSMIAASILARNGYENVININGGMDAILKTKLPVLSETQVA
ncbi:MAG: rhodanese-like domain-containing protein [Cytophagales bacterium]|nr:rhodanese-like domain-containing protein [Bernardetiaceae bacterium]MDW8203643.1 rhodanese-like domain-containing protein [Cytophagales bacterium]